MTLTAGPVTNGIGAGFIAAHKVLPARFLHSCAWCAYRFKRLHAHREQDCLKEKAFRDKKAAESNASALPVSDHSMLLSHAIIDVPVPVATPPAAHSPADPAP